MDPSSPSPIAGNQALGTTKAALPGRLTSMDAYRGLVMFLMMAEVLRLSRMAELHPGSDFWHVLGFHQSHVAWIGCSLHDMIQPSFSFLVGVALPFSIASRFARGQSKGGMIAHAAVRAVILILLGVFLRSLGRPLTYWTFEDTLTQIGLGYFFLFLLGFRGMKAQWLALALILVGYWAAFALYPLPGPDFKYSSVGVPDDWPKLMTGFAAHWNKNSNLAWAFDTWFLNLFPREKPFVYNGGGYATLSFIPTLGTMILGLIAGKVLRNEKRPGDKLRWFLVAGVALALVGALLGLTGICPVVKRIWTPSWTLFSGGVCFLFLAAFYGIIEMALLKRWAFPLVVIGMNSIAAYCIAHLFESFVSKSLRTHLGGHYADIFGAGYEPVVEGAAILLVFWLILYWMYRRKIFLRI